MESVDVARTYMKRGWYPIPIPAKSKKPVWKDWPSRRLGEGELIFFVLYPNIGVLLGEPSGWLIDVDLDHPLAVELAPEFLPPTGSVFGRASKRRSHWLYVVTGPISTHQRKLDKRQMIVELRSTGLQTVFPGSVHPEGETIEWDQEGEPAQVPPNLLLAAVNALAAEVTNRLGIRKPPADRKSMSVPPRTAGGLSGPGSLDRCLRYLEKCPNAISGQGGHNATLHAAAVCYRFGLADDEALRAMQWFNATKTGNEPWTEKELAHKLTDARSKVEADGCFGSFLVTAANPVASGTVLVQSEWPELELFDQTDLPEFPTHVLPAVIRRWVEAESCATQTPADLAGLLTLAACSMSLARCVVVEPRPGWVEPSNLFVSVLLEPGNRKSAVFSDVIQPFRELEAEIVEAARPAIAAAQSARRQDEARLKQLEKKAGERCDSAARLEASKLAAELAEQPEPALPRLLIDDATSEKLGMMLAEQKGKIASMSPEGGVFDLMAGQYSKSGMPQFGVYLMAHAGDDLVTDRVTRKSVSVKRPALTCAYAMQPAVIMGLADNTAFRGRGLLARFLYAAPTSWVGDRQIAPDHVPDAIREDYRQSVRSLFEAVANLPPDQDPLLLQLDDLADAELQEWEEEIEGMLDEGGDMEIMRDWGAKLAGATLRLAAVLHCVEHGVGGTINWRTIKAAIEIGRYLIPHADAVLKMMKAKEGKGDDDALYLLRWILRHKRAAFTKTEAQHHGKRRFPNATDIDAPLAELESRGYIRKKPTEVTGPGRPPSPAFEVNPLVLCDGNSKKRSRYSQNSDLAAEKGGARSGSETGSTLESGGEGGDFGNIGSAMQGEEASLREQVTI